MNKMARKGEVKRGVNMIRPLQAKRKGSATALVLLAVVILFAMGVGLLSLGLHSRLLGIRTSSEIAARCAADTGLTKAVFEMNEKLKVKPWNDSTLPQETNQTMANCDATYSYTVTGDVGSGYSVEAIGKYGRVQRRVSGTLKLKGPFEFAVFVDGSVELKNSAVVDGYNYGDDGGILKVGTNSTAESSVALRNSATINGDVAVGLGGDPDTVIDAAWAFITGDTYAAPEIYELPAITVPAHLLDLPSQGIIEDDATVSGTAKYDEINLKNGKVITINGAAVLYIIGDVTLMNSAELRIVDEATNPDASLTLYLGGDVEVKNSGTINNMAEVPKKFKIYGLDSCQRIILKNGSEFYGAIYAPNADIIMMNSADAYGAIVAESFEQKNSATFNYDASLRDASIDDEVTQFTVKDWHEE
jgi:hypothetical protein